MKTLEEDLQTERSERAKLQEQLTNLSSLVINTNVLREDDKHQKLHIFASCQDAMKRGVSESGVYTLNDNLGTFSAYIATVI